jgi:hypothetical protein
MEMEIKSTALRDVKNEFENNSRETLLEEIIKHRKMINGLSFGIQNAIQDLKRPHSDGSIALEYLEKSLESATSFEKSEYFNINKNKEASNKRKSK